MDKLLSFEGAELILSVVVAIFASSGFWVYMSKREEKRSRSDKLLLGLAHVRIVELSTKYINQHYITKDEYETLHDYLYKPYTEMGGNGATKRLMAEVEKLPICETAPDIKTTPLKRKRSVKNEVSNEQPIV